MFNQPIPDPSSHIELHAVLNRRGLVQHVGGDPANRPLPTTPRYKVGDHVIAPNGELRVIEGMAWAASQQLDQGDPVYWGWVLRTRCPRTGDKGLGYEGYYEPVKNVAQ